MSKPRKRQKAKSAQASKPKHLGRLDRQLAIAPFSPNRRSRLMSKGERNKYFDSKIALLQGVARVAYHLQACTERELKQVIAKHPSECLDFVSACPLKHWASSLFMMLSSVEHRVRAARGDAQN